MTPAGSRDRALQLLLLGAFAVTLLTGLLGSLPWWLDPRLRCVRAYEASVGPRRYQPERAGDLGTDPWGRPFRATLSGRLQGGFGRLDLYSVTSAGPDGLHATGDDVAVPGDESGLVRFARSFRNELRILGLLTCCLGLFAWSLVAAHRPRWLRVAAAVILPLPAAAWTGQLVLRGLAAWDQGGATTPVAGSWAPHVTAYAAGVVGAALLAQLRARRDALAGPPAA